MPATMDLHGSPVPSTNLSHQDSTNLTLELDGFQTLVSDLLHTLSSDPDLLSLSWIRKLLDSFIILHDHFRILLRTIPIPKPPLDRMLSDYFDRSVKALDVCNAIRDGIDHVADWGNHLDIVLLALGNKNRSLGEGQFRRARKALTDLTIAMLDDKDSASTLTSRNRSFGRNSCGTSSSKDKHFRSLSWSVSRNWSAARQLQAIGNNLSAPKSHDIVATNGIAVPIFTMNSVLLFVMWALVAAIPCQDRGLQTTHFSIPRGFLWATPLLALHERIFDESKKRDRKNSCGLLQEIHRIEKCSRRLSQLLDSAVHFPLTVDKELEVMEEMQELAKICQAMKEELEPLERQVRDVFHRIVRSRTEGLDCFGQSMHH